MFWSDWNLLNDDQKFRRLSEFCEQADARERRIAGLVEELAERIEALEAKLAQKS